MAKYRKKPIIVDAVKLTSPITIDTADGKMTGNVGDYLITQEDGTQYPLSADAFVTMFEPLKAHMDAKIILFKVLRVIKRKLF